MKIMELTIKICWLFMIAIILTLPSGMSGQASLLEAVIYQLTEGNPQAVGSLFE